MTAIYTTAGRDETPAITPKRPSTSAPMVGKAINKSTRTRPREVVRSLEEVTGNIVQAGVGTAWSALGNPSLATPGTGGTMPLLDRWGREVWTIMETYAL